MYMKCDATARPRCPVHRGFEVLHTRALCASTISGVLFLPTELLQLFLYDCIFHFPDSRSRWGRLKSSYACTVHRFGLIHFSWRQTLVVRWRTLFTISKRLCTHHRIHDIDLFDVAVGRYAALKMTFKGVKVVLLDIGRCIPHMYKYIYCGNFLRA